MYHKLAAVYVFVLVISTTNAFISNCTLFGLPCTEGDSAACCGYPLNKCQTLGSCSACVSDLFFLNVLFLPGCFFEKAVNTIADVASALNTQQGG